MVTRRLSHRVVARVAVAGLAIGLAALVVLTLRGATWTRDATDQVRASNQVAAAWDQVFVQVALEDEALHRYLATGTDTDRRALLAATGTAEPTLAWIDAHGGHEEEFQVQMLHQDYAGYENTLRGVAQAGQRGDQAEIDAYTAPAALAYASVRRQVVANVDRKRRELTGYLTMVDRRNHRLESFAGVVFGLDIALLGLCTWVLVGYQRRVEQQAAASRHQALHDPLTGLGNRVLLDDRTEQALRIAARTGELVGLLMIDLDGFKQVNDQYGHATGDELLRAVAARITGALRATDTVARLGGDEFAVLLPNVGATTHALEVAGRVRAAISRPVELPAHTVEVGASVGLALHLPDGEDAEHLFRHADVAMYQAKRGRLGVCVHQPDAIAAGATP